MGEEFPHRLIGVRHVPQQGGGGIGHQEPLGQTAVLVHAFLVCCEEEKGLVFVLYTNVCRQVMLYGLYRIHVHGSKG